ncbi:MAG TPA: carboxypeptidase-like regulatory domain-containing protein [Thermoanaerobaculia bacterium]|nr:carboxypeptidase-like regulatory domain-containing protein [Thermoanaerobaculia bacterium]
MRQRNAGEVRTTGMRPWFPLLASVLTVSCHRESPTAPAPPASTTSAQFVGRTLDPQGVPVPNVELSIMSESNVVSARVVSDAEGRFTIAGLQPGGYGVSFRVNGGREQHGGSVRLFAGTNIHNVLVSSCRVPYGTVRDATTGRPIAGAKVTIFHRESVTDGNGHYQIDFGCGAVQGSTMTMSAEHADYERAQTLTRASFLCTCAYDFLLKRR